MIEFCWRRRLSGMTTVLHLEQAGRTDSPDARVILTHRLSKENSTQGSSHSPDNV
jgi:hypothetical protein